MDNKTFYENTVVYDAAFDERDFKLECDFLEWCFDKHAKIKKADLENKSFLELACGPAKHARLMSEREWKSFGLDISAEMLEYAKSKAEEEGLKVKFVKEDMRKFKLKKPVSLAANLLESIAHILTNKDMIAHLKAVSKNLVKGGIYVIEATHPRYFFPATEANHWVVEKDGEKYEITFGTPDDKYDSITQLWATKSIVKITDSNGVERINESEFSTRWYLAQEMQALIELSGGFSKVWFYGSLYSIPPNPLDDSENSDAMVIVLRK